MAQFRGTIQGSRGSASRTGHKTAGLITTCNGANVGITVEAKFESGCDIFYIYKKNTHGDKILINTIYG